MLEWSDDDESSGAPPPSTEAPPRNTRVEEQVKRGEEVPKQWAMGVLEWQTMGVPAQQAEEVIERQVD